MAYHPHTDGETERLNQELEIYFCMFCQNNPSDWKPLLSTAKFAHNQHVHSTTHQTPFYLMMGYKPQAIPTPLKSTNAPSVEKRLEDLN